jgi:hypothetical protein
MKWDVLEVIRLAPVPLRGMKWVGRGRPTLPFHHHLLPAPRRESTGLC